jgi:hypothetical protein
MTCHPQFCAADASQICPSWPGFTIAHKNLVFHGYFKLPAAQTAQENCVAHNGSLIPIPGRDVMVQAFYQGGITVFDWTDIKKPKEIAFFDRGPVDANRLVMAGSWSAYWHNGLIVSSEIARGLDVYELLPSGLITQNELDAAKTARFAKQPSILLRAIRDGLLKPLVVAARRHVEHTAHHTVH